MPYEKEFKFLGMNFDATPTWSSHIDALKLKVKTSMNIVKVVSGSTVQIPEGEVNFFIIITGDTALLVISRSPQRPKRI